MTKDEYFKLCTALVQEQVYAWGIASSFVCLGSPPGMADAMLLKPNWSIQCVPEEEKNRPLKQRNAVTKCRGV